MTYRPRTNPLTTGVKLSRMSQTAAALRKANRAASAKAMENAEAALRRDRGEIPPDDEA